MATSETSGTSDIEKNQKLLRAMNNATSSLLVAKEEDALDTLNKIMEYMGRGLDVDRVQIWYNEFFNGEQCFTLKYEWLSPRGGAIKPSQKDVPYPYSSVPTWLSQLESGGGINGPIEYLSESEIKFLKKGEVISIITVPLYQNDRLIGFLSLDDCQTSRTFSDSEFESVCTAGLMISNVFEMVERGSIMRDHELALSLSEQEANQRAQLMIEAAPIIIEFWNEKGICTDCNHTAYRLDKYPNKQIYIDSVNSQPTTPESMMSHTMWQTFLRNIFDDGYGHFTFKSTKQDRYFDVTGTQTYLNGERFVITYSTDVTRKRDMIVLEDRAKTNANRAQIAEESNRAKSRFLARMSHEIRTPITAVLGISDIELQKKDIPERTAESLLKIHSAGNLLYRIIDNLLDLSKIEAEKMGIIKEQYNISNMISEISYLHYAYLGNKNIKFKLEVSENIPATLVGDALRIEQIIINLMSNAFKYTPSGSVEMTWRFDNNEILVVTIADTGLGMTQDMVSELYNQGDYARFHEKENRNIGGTGLGMPIVFSMAAIMNADIDIHSEVGVGTHITVRIPQEPHGDSIIGKERAFRLQQFEEKPKLNASHTNFIPESMPYGNVLIVDDDETNLYVANGLLGLYDINVDNCTSGTEAIAKVSDGKIYDLILLDQMMPGLSGEETFQAIRGLGYKNPIIAFTADAVIGQAEKFTGLGFDGFLSKPIQTKNLDMLLHKFIKDTHDPSLHVTVSKNQSVESFQTGIIGELRADFGRKHRNTYQSIIDAINTDDIKTAHRLAHNIKGISGLIKEEELTALAQEVESLLKKGEIPTATQLQAFGDEMTRIIDLVAPPTIKNEVALETFAKLEPLLKRRDTECLSLIDDLKSIPETAVLVRQIEDFDFAVAARTLATLIDIYGGLNE